MQPTFQRSAAVLILLLISLLILLLLLQRTLQRSALPSYLHHITTHISNIPTITHFAVVPAAVLGACRHISSSMKTHLYLATHYYSYYYTYPPDSLNRTSGAIYRGEPTHVSAKSSGFRLFAKPKSAIFSVATCRS